MADYILQWDVGTPFGGTSIGVFGGTSIGVFGGTPMGVFGITPMECLGYPKGVFGSIHDYMTTTI